MQRFHLPRWMSHREERNQLMQHLQQHRLATYGFAQVPEAEKTAYVRRHFDSVAHRYDLMNTILSFGVHYLWKRHVVNRMRLEPGNRVLDVCGGTGDLAILADRKVGPDGRVILYDINREMILAGRNKPTNVGHRRRIAYVQGDIETISFPDNSMDAAMVGFGIRNVTHMERGFAEMFRVLKPGGVFMCLEFSQPVWKWFRLLYDFYSFYIMPWLGEKIAGTRQAYIHLPETIRLFPLPDELADMLRTIGFDAIQYERLTNGIAVVHLARKPIDTHQP